MTELEARVALLEKQVEKLLVAWPPSEPEATKPASETKKIHPSTRRAMERYAPPLSEKGIKNALARIPVGRRISRNEYAMALSKTVHGKHDDIRLKAQRHLYWLKHLGHITFNEKTFEYERPVPTCEQQSTKGS